MSYVPNENPVDIARGLILGKTPISGYGRRTTAGAESNVLWPNGTYLLPPAAGIQLSVQSSSASDGVAGTGIQSIVVHGLDANLAEVSETVVLNGTTPVLTARTDWRFVQTIHMMTYGSGKKAAGNITLTNGGNTYGLIATGAVRDQCSVKMVPAGKRLVVKDLFAGSSSGTAAASTTVQIVSTYFDGHDYSADSVFIPFGEASYQDNSGGLTVTTGGVFPAGTAVGFMFTTDKAATVTGTWFGWLEDAA